MEYQVQAVNLPSDEMSKGYLEAAEWIGLVEDADRDALEQSVAARWSDDSLREAREDCEAFGAHAQSECPQEWERYVEEHGLAQAGHDFYLSRNGHGAGFFDRGRGRGYPGLQRVAETFGSAYVWYDDESETLSLD